MKMLPARDILHAVKVFLQKVYRVPMTSTASPWVLFYSITFLFKMISSVTLLIIAFEMHCKSTYDGER